MGTTFRAILDEELKRCKDEQAERLRDKRVIAIAEVNGEFVVERWSSDSVWPTMEYPTRQKAAARVLQLLGIGPVSPQTWPERHCIGSVSLEEGEGE